ncbi:MAG: type II toxin-antitoxin system Phd/YefM family antitoxin [Pseudomonadota bacterium]
MRISRMTSAMFNQNPSKAKKQADNGPLVITDHGEAAYVLMRYEAFEASWQKPKSLYDALRDPHATVEGDFAPERHPLDDRDVGF